MAIVVSLTVEERDAISLSTAKKAITQRVAEREACRERVAKFKFTEVLLKSTQSLPTGRMEMVEKAVVE